MSDFHQVVYPMLKLNQDEVFKRIQSLFRKHKVRFLHSVRGLFWDKEWNEFSPDLDKELEHLDKFNDAYMASKDWTCACFDFRFLDWAFEFYMFKGSEPSHSDLMNIAMSFPHSLYKVSTQDFNVAKMWINLMKDVGSVIGVVSMVCGPDVLIRPHTESDLLAEFQNYLNIYQYGTYSFHTMLCPRSFLNELDKKKIIPEVFSVSSITDNILLITILKSS